MSLPSSQRQTLAHVPGSSPTTIFRPLRSRPTLATVCFISIRLSSSMALGPDQKYTHRPADTARTGMPPPMSVGDVYSGARDISSHVLISPSKTSSRITRLVGKSNHRRVLLDAVTMILGFCVQMIDLIESLCTPSPIS